ncbi:lymphocyte antigen 96 isoform X1 [Python bivittatus]|uniref:Lymphocyte antigen 96 isoform X1 n=1 Tax=Python bivittatus TaxID=176946 RepID=A0A9F5N4N1_PYTBI|nr:lymphocyte antigen 96 isoform X1 [Python bivittatus]
MDVTNLVYTEINLPFYISFMQRWQLCLLLQCAYRINDPWPALKVPGTDTFFFSPKPCRLRDHSEWQGTIFWIPKADLTVVHARLRLWNGPLRAFEWESIVCHGVDDDYSYCGALKGETINTTARISGSGSRYLKLLEGEYIVSLEVFSGLKELITCVNYTLILK